jgi:hypothetical protein
MKKILTFILLACMSVASIAQATNMQLNLRSLMEKERLGNAMQTIQEHPARKMAAQTAAPAQLAPTKRTAQTAPANSELDTTEVYFSSFYEDPIYFEVDTVVGRQGDTVVTGGDWYFVLKNERYQFIFDIYGGSPDDMAGHYTEKDLDIMFSWCAIPDANGQTSYYETCDLNIQSEKTGSKIKYIVEATIVTTLGVGGEVNGAFNIYAEHETVVANQRWDVALLNCQVIPEDDLFRIHGADDTIAVDMTIFSDFGVEGYYSHKSIDPEESHIVHRGEQKDIMEMEGVIFSSPMITGGVAYVFMTEVLTTDTLFYNIAMEAPIIPTDTVEVICQNMAIDDTGGTTQATITVSASNKRYSILAGYNDTELVTPAIYSGDKAMVYLTDLATDEEISALDCTIEVDGNRLKGYTVHIEMLGNDHKYYVMDLAYKIPTPVKTVTLDFPNSSKSMYYVDDLGLEELQLANYNEEYSVAFDILYINQIMGGEFTLTDLWADQTFVVHHRDEGDYYVPIAKVDGKIEQKNEVTYLDATVIGFDSVKYEISMFYEVPTPTETITYEFNGLGKDEVLFTNALPQGIFILEAMSEDGNLMANVQVNRIQNENMEGTFYNDGMFTHNDFYTDNTFVKVWNETKKAFEEFYLQKGTMTVTIDEDNVINAVASFICDDAKQYDLTFKVQYERAHLPYDSEEGAVDYTYPSDSHVTITDWIEGYGMIWLELVPGDFTNVCAIFFNADEMDPEIGIPAGVYPIDKSYEAGTVVASNGIAMNGAPLEAFFCGLTEGSDGYYYTDPLYCLVDGTITVENVEGQLKVEVDAVNSYDVPVKLHYCGSITPVDNVEVESNTVQKRIIDGQLVILKNGKTYTIMGAEMK